MTEYNGGPDTVGIILILGCLFFLAMHAVGPNPVPFIAAGDLFDHEPKAAASSLAASATWVGALIVSLTFPLCQKYLKEFMFVPFVVCIVCQLIPFYFYFPETKGISNSVISNMFQIENAWKTAIGLQTKDKKATSNEFSQHTASNVGLHENSNVCTLSIKSVNTETLSL